MIKNIKKVAVLGSGIMGSGIACHLANVDIEVFLLDMVPEDKLSEKNKKSRNSLVDSSLLNSVKSKPSPLFTKSKLKNITTGNFTDDFDKIKDYDWIIEVVVERLEVKKIILEKVDQFRKNGTLVSSNTSGIPINSMLENRSEDFKKHFFGSHFFNPARYLRLLEIIPTNHTNKETIEFMIDFGEKILGKSSVLCKDTPGFIANRIGVFAIQELFHTVKEMKLSVGEVDLLTGPIMGRAKSATFRTCDVVGLDTLVHVANGLKINCPTDERNHVFEVPDFVKKMTENNWLGSKSGQGFYKKSKDENGKRNILELDLSSLEYSKKPKSKFETISKAKKIENLTERMKVLFNGKDRAGEFYRKVFAGLFSYSSCRIPEISEDIFLLDEAVKAGFGWEMGPFEMWDAVGFIEGLDTIKKLGLKTPNWIEKIEGNIDFNFYGLKQGIKYCYDIKTEQQRIIPGLENIISLKSLDKSSLVWGNKEASILDIGDGIINVSFHSKMNTIGSEILQALNHAIDLAEGGKYKGVVIANEGANFSAGANVGILFMLAAEQEYEELDMAIREFQNTTMRLRYSSIPVVAAPHGMTLGGGCEICLHADKVIAHAETYMGLVEFGVGLIPGGGGTKEMALRFSDGLKQGDMRINRFRDNFLTIGQAKVSSSASEAIELGFLRKGIDEIIISRKNQLTYAKEMCLKLYEKGYVQKNIRKDITVLGQEGLGIVYAGANSMKSGNYMSEYDQVISEKLGYVLAGGDLSQLTEVSEKYLLDIERKAFLELCSEKKTLERIQSLLQTGKILRN
ncbi:MAG: 3-hydroxyacyl-CoA dehydrogenase NAD-binding domain-containing protein [Flavobacteriales bacterium]